MVTPSEVPMMRKCHSCERQKPEADFLTYASGKLAGRRVTVCTTCRMKMSNPPAVCRVCGELRLLADFDNTAEDGKTCKVCLIANPDAYRKACTKCGQDRKVSQFSKQSKTAYRQPTCQTCDSKRTVEKNRRIPKVVAARRKRHNESMKAQAYAAYGGAKCACCGETELSFLTLDHVNNDGAEWRRQIFKSNKGRGGISTYEWCKRNGFPPIFQVLCWNCQQGKRFNGGICPHQTKTCNDYPAREYGQAAGSASGPAVN